MPRTRIAALFVAGLSACTSPSAADLDARGVPEDGAPSPTPDGAAPDAGAPSQELLFLAAYLGGIRSYAIDPATGALTESDGSPFDAQKRFYGIALDPSRPRLYLADELAGSVDAYRIATDTGGLEAEAGFPVELDLPAISIAVDPQGRFVYVGDFDIAQTSAAIHVFAVDPTTGALAPAAGSPFPVDTSANVIAADPSGRFVYVTTGAAGVQALAVDASGTLTAVDGSPFAAATVFSGWMAFHPDGGVLYNARSALNALAVDAETGALTAVAGSPFAAGAPGDLGSIGVAVDPRGRFVAVADFAVGRISVYPIGAGGGLDAVPASSVVVASGAYSVAIDPDGRFVYVAGDGTGISAFSIDPTTFALTLVAGSPFPADGLQPEMVILRVSDR